MKSLNHLPLLFVLFLFLSCEENQKNKFNSEREIFTNVQRVLSKNYSLINASIEKPNQYSTIISLNAKSISKLQGMENQDKESLLKVFEEKNVENISLYDSTCFLFLIGSEGGFLGSKIYYYLFSEKDDCIKKIKKDFDIIKQESLDKQWIYIVRRESLAN